MDIDKTLPLPAHRLSRPPLVLSAVGGMTALALVLAGCAGWASSPASGPDQQSRPGHVTAADRGQAAVPAAARAIMAKPAYRTARWTYQVSDLNTGEVLLANRPNELAFTASTAKQFTVGATYDARGAGTRLTTPVFATGRTSHGVLHGNLVLVASGDLAMGGRNAPQGRVDQSFSATTVDHVYGDVAPNAVRPPGNPLAGLDNLAAQVAAKGIHRIRGDVIIDERLWRVFDGLEGPVHPIFVNDNLLDITVTPGSVGETAAADASPRTSAYRLRSQVRTVSGADATLRVAADPRHPRRLLVTGTVGTDAGPRLTIYRVPEPAAWARTLFVEALSRAGVRVDAPPLAANNARLLPADGSYRTDEEVAKIQSPPLHAFGSMILETSYNTGANTMLCLLAAHEGSTDCLDGLKPIRALVERAGMVADDVMLVDGQGADPASVAPKEMTKFLRWTHGQPWAQVFEKGQPVLAESGTLAGNSSDSSAKGHVRAKTGTSAHPDPTTGRALFNVQRLSGFMTTSDGRELVFDLAMSGGTYPDLLTGLVQAGEDVSGVAAAFQQALSQ